MMTTNGSPPHEILATEEETKLQASIQDIIIQAQRERQQMPVQRQLDNYSTWMHAENSLAEKTLMDEDFTKQKPPSAEWHFAMFYPGVSAEEPAAEIREKWVQLVETPLSDGLELRQIIIKALPSITLRSLGVDVEIIIRLQGESMFWICTRGAGIRDPNTAICLISKEINSNATFISLGGPIGAQQEFKFFKKTQIPEVEVSEEALLEDYQDIHIRYFDNGDDKIQVSAYIEAKTKKFCYLNSDKFIPWLHPTNLMLAGSGMSAILKSVMIKQTHRQMELDTTNRDPNCQCSCSLF